MDTNKVVAAYVKLRDMKAARAKQFKEEIAKIEEAMDKLDARLLAHLQAANAESIRTEAGTFFKTTKTSATVADWDSFLAYVLANEAYHMLEKRVAKQGVVEFKEEKNDLPPGVDWREVQTIGVRRS
jgi:hypothetical protein